MARITNLALNRKFASEHARREKAIAPEMQKIGECVVPVCLRSSRDIFAGPGMILRTNSHKECRKAAMR